MPSPDKKKTIGRFVRLTEDADRKLHDLRRRLSVYESRDLAIGDVIDQALDCLERELQAEH
jgi:hypothetical protein